MTQTKAAPSGAWDEPKPTALLVLADGTVLEGFGLGATGSAVGEPMHQFGPPTHLHIDGPFYVGIGFCSHLPDKSDTAVLSDIVLENSAGNVH